MKLPREIRSSLRAAPEMAAQTVGRMSGPLYWKQSQEPNHPHASRNSQGHQARGYTRSIGPKTMVSFNLVQHHIVRSHESTRLCDGQTAGNGDISGADLDALRDARSQATLCPACQQDLAQPAALLRTPRYRNGNQTLAHLYTVPVQYDFDDIRNCPHCRETPRERNCRAWENARDGARVLHQEARRIARNAWEMADATGGRPANIYEFVDDTVADFALDTPPWQEAEELVGTDLERAKRILDERATPGGKAGWPQTHPASH